MELILERKYLKANYTIGKLYLRPSNTAKQALLPLRGLGGPEQGEGLQFFCNTLECPVGTLEEMRTGGSRKAIPPGTYNIRMAWSSRFQEHLPLIEDISLPLAERRGGLGGRGSILIHPGNSVHDTVGCILVGKNTQVGRLVDSRKTLNILLGKIRPAIKSGEEVTIIIK